MSVAAASQQLRSSVDGLAALANRDLAGLWRQVSTAVQAREALFDVLPHVIDSYGAAAATIATAWYDDLRAEQGIGGAYVAEPAPVGDLGANALVGWATSTTTEVVRDGSVTPQFRSLIEGGLQRRVMNPARYTVMRSSYRDPEAGGWMRTGSGSCAFCSMLIGRAIVFRTESSADFASHDHCHCGVAPTWGGLARPVRAYTPSSRNISDADRARVRAWIASH